MLAQAVKFWAKRRAINDSTNFTLNSFVWVMMVILFLQKRKPRILPLLSVNGEQEQAEILKKVTKMPAENPDGLIVFPTYEIPKPEVWVVENTEKIAELLVEFFRFYTQFDYARDCISVRSGKPIPKTSTLIVQTTTPTVICVEDPFILTENCARTVTAQSVVHIRAEFNRAYSLLSGKAGGSEICDFDKVCEVPRNKRQKEIDLWKLPEQN